MTIATSEPVAHLAPDVVLDQGVVNHEDLAFSRLAPLCRRIEYRHTFRFVVRDPVAPVDDFFVVLVVERNVFWRARIRQSASRAAQRRVPGVLERVEVELLEFNGLAEYGRGRRSRSDGRRASAAESRPGRASSPAAQPFVKSGDLERWRGDTSAFLGRGSPLEEGAEIAFWTSCSRWRGFAIALLGSGTLFGPGIAL